MNQGFQIIAHRGYKALVCENTLPAFTQALKAGATMLELDVHLSADGEAVLLHDATMQRLANDRRHVANLTWNALKTMPLYDKRARSHPEGHVLRLEELFSHIGSDCNYCVEIKYAPRRSSLYHHKLCETVCAIIQQHQLSKHCMFVCSELPLLAKLQAMAPHIPAGWVFEFEKQLLTLPKIRSMNLVLCPRAGLLTEQRAREMIRMGFSLMPWTVNRESEMRHLMDWGVAGITTDEVERLVGVCSGKL